MDLRPELEEILHNVGPENIWRPIYDNENELLANGIGDMRDGSPRDLSKVDFQGKTVLDLGCNFGFYSFLAKRFGAKKVVGIDSDDRVIKGCKLLKAMHGVKDVYFYVGDFMTSNSLSSFDISIMINFIGKKWVRKGFQKVLNAIERISISSMIISVRPYFRITKHLGGDIENIIQRYSSVYIKNNRFYLMDFICDYFYDNWDMSVISTEYDDPAIKKTLLFSRK